MKRELLAAFAVCLLFAACGGATSVTYFQAANIGGGIAGSATATVTSGAGYVDILLQNTSPLGPSIGVNGIANPFITEIEFFIPSGWALNESASYVQSLATTLFAQGAGNAAVNYAPRNLYYKITDSDSPGMNKCFMFGDADNLRNDNSIGSINVLNGSNVPQEGWAEGFLAAQPDQYSGTVFDAALFHFVFTGDTPPESLFADPGSLITKFVGGGYSSHVSNVPEPATLAILGLGGMALLRKRAK